jgi:hypothetical protein
VNPLTNPLDGVLLINALAIAAAAAVAIHRNHVNRPRRSPPQPKVLLQPPPGMSMAVPHDNDYIGKGA